MKDGALRVMVINKYLTMNTPATINLQNFVVGGKAHAWQLTASNAITRLADATVVSGALNVVLPPQSITLLVVPSADRVPPNLKVRSCVSNANWCAP